MSGTGRHRRTVLWPTSAAESKPCKYSWALEVSERRSGSTTSVGREADVSGLANTDRCSSAKWREHVHNRLEASEPDWNCAGYLR